MDVEVEGISRGCHRWGEKTPASLGYPLSVFNQNSTLRLNLHHFPFAQEHVCAIILPSGLIDLVYFSFKRRDFAVAISNHPDPNHAISPATRCRAPGTHFDSLC